VQGGTQNILARAGMSSPQQNLAHNMNRQFMSQQKQNALAGMPGAPAFHGGASRNALDGMQFDDTHASMGATGVPTAAPPQTPKSVSPQASLPTTEKRLTPEGYQDLLLASGKIKRVCLTTGDTIHVREATPDGYQDIELAGGKIKRINLEDGESEIL